MAVVSTVRFACDGPHCGAFVELDGEWRYHDYPDGWGQISMSTGEELPDCSCKCHEWDEREVDIEEDEENPAGHESWECGTCPDEGTAWTSILCTQCLGKAKAVTGLPHVADSNSL